MKIRFDSRPRRADEQRGMKIPYPPEKRKPPVWRWYALLLLFLSPVFYFAWTLAVPHLTVQAPGFVRMPIYSVDAPDSGEIVSLAVSETSKVKKGAPLLTLRNRDLDASIAALRREISELKTLKSKEHREKSAMYKERLALLSEQIAAEEEHLGQLKRLMEQGAATRDEVARQQAKIRDLKRQKSELLFSLRSLFDADPGKGRVADPQIVRLKSALEKLLARRNALHLHAPAGGRVSDLEAKPNLFVEKGTHLLDIVDESHVYVQAYFDPKDFDDIVRGSAAIVKFADGRSFDAFVDETPAVSTRLPADFTLLKENKRAVSVHLAFPAPLPARYRVANMPVTVYLKTPVAEWISGL